MLWLYAYASGALSAEENALKNLSDWVRRTIETVPQIWVIAIVAAFVVLFLFALVKKLLFLLVSVGIIFVILAGLWYFGGPALGAR